MLTLPEQHTDYVIVVEGLWALLLAILVISVAVLLWRRASRKLKPPRRT